MTTVEVGNQLVPGQCPTGSRDQREGDHTGVGVRDIISHGWQSQAGLHLSGLRVHHRLHLTIYHLIGDIYMPNGRPTHLNQNYFENIEVPGTRRLFGPMVHLPVILSPTPFPPGRERDGSETEIEAQPQTS